MLQTPKKNKSSNSRTNWIDTETTFTFLKKTTKTAVFDLKNTILITVVVLKCCNYCNSSTFYVISNYNVY